MFYITECSQSVFAPLFLKIYLTRAQLCALCKHALFFFLFVFCADKPSLGERELLASLG